jgi:hypothetical protein
MKSKKYSIWLLVIILLSGLTSCKKFLDAVPDNSVAVPKSISDLQALLDNTSRMNFQTSPDFGESSADDYYLTDDVYNSFDVSWQKIYTWQREDYNFANDWSTGYLVIYNANYCLDQLPNIKKSNANATAWNNVYGSALFFRSYNFLNLLWVYAKAYYKSTSATDPGIVLRLTSDFNSPSQRASTEDCYNRVLEDAKEAVSYLPDLSSNVMRPSKAAAYGLLARAYLSMRVYDSALKYSNLCLSLNHYLMDFNTDPDIIIDADMPFLQFNKEIIFYTEMTTYDGIYHPVFSFVDTVLYAHYNENDLRRAAFFKMTDNHFQFKGSYSGNFACFSGIATDEMYLIKAECEARLKKVDESISDLNTLLQKRWNRNVPFDGYTATNASDALNIILLERRKELLMRGLRWMDIKRLNKENAAIGLTRKVGGQTYSLAPNSSYFALPLPADIIKESGIEQN